VALGSLLVVRYNPGNAKTFMQMTFRRKAVPATQSHLPAMIVAFRIADRAYPHLTGSTI
jgi:hypothetical protein